MPLNARRLIRKMRGGAQSHLLEADDSRFYVVKFTNNPQHRRILVNEFIASVFLRYLQVSSPETALIRVSEQFLTENPEVYLQLGTRRLPVPPGWHFGSLFPGHPDRQAVYDFVPDVLLAQIANPRDFLGALVVDRWLGNTDGRQAVFFRARLREWSSPAAHPRKTGFIAVMIDQGFVFNGPYWDFPDSPIQGLYPRRAVYEQVTSWDSFQPWLDQVVHFPESIIDEAYRQIPPEWVQGDEDALEQLLGTLLKRRKRIPDLLTACRRARGELFPNWT